MAGYWEFPGGKVEKGEAEVDALVRELSEELKVQAEIGDFIGQNVHSYDFADIHLSAYWVADYRGDFRLSDHDQLLWVLPEELRRLNLAPADVPLIEPISRGIQGL